MRSVVLVALLAGAACGGGPSSRDGQPVGLGGAPLTGGAGGTSSGGQASGGSANGGTASGGAASGGAASGGSEGGGTASGDVPPAPASGCGTAACDDWRTPTLASCCRDDGACGWTPSEPVSPGYWAFTPELVGKCTAFEAPGTPGTECTDVEVRISMAAVLAAVFPACCRADGRCGVVMHDSSGCIAREDVDGKAATCTP